MIPIDADVYIKRADALHVLEQLHDNSRTTAARFAYANAYNHMTKVPTVDPVEHGRWIVHQDGYAECSQCRKMMFIPKVFVKHPENITDRYCNMCGAKMDEVSE